MGNALYLRRYRLTVSDGKLDTVVSELRCSFTVKLDLKKEPNTCEVKLYNCAPDTIARLTGTVNGPITLEAGYVSELGVVFKGTVERVLTAKVGGDIVTTFQAHSGVKAFAQERVQVAISGSTDAATVFKAIAGKMGKDTLTQKALGVVQQVTSKAFPRGYAFEGYTLDGIAQLLKPLGLTPSIQNGELVLLSETSTTGEAVLSSDTGMLGSPQLINAEKDPKPGALKPKATVKAKNLLRYVLMPGTSVQISSTYSTGRYRIETVTHAGDTHGPAWTSEMDLIVLK